MAEHEKMRIMNTSTLAQSIFLTLLVSAVALHDILLLLPLTNLLLESLQQLQYSWKTLVGGPYAKPHSVASFHGRREHEGQITQNISMRLQRK
jgi:hypothetical protein